MDDLNERTLDWVDGRVLMVDQTKLPGEFTLLEIDNVADMVASIQRLSVRGAPAIGVAGGYGVVIATREFGTSGPAFETAVSSLRDARPTAVNLARMVDRVASINGDFDERLVEANSIRDYEIGASFSMGEYGADLVAELTGLDRIRAMTVCNTGSLAAVQKGTALGVIQTLHERGMLEEAIPMESRPLLQGARLTAWELERMGAPHRLIVDSAAPFLLSRGHANVALAGADRIAANGDSANKIGTFSLALGAKRAGVPFIIVAPESTIDMETASGDSIEIEDRGAAEVISLQGVKTAPDYTAAINPAFDVTPHDLITAIVTDRRIIRIDRGESLDSVPLGETRSAPSAGQNTKGENQ